MRAPDAPIACPRATAPPLHVDLLHIDARARDRPRPPAPRTLHSTRTGRRRRATSQPFSTPCASLRRGSSAASWAAMPLVACATMRAIGCEAELLRAFGGHHDERGGAIVHRRGVAGGHGAVLLERRLQGAQGFGAWCRRAPTRPGRRRAGRPSSAESATGSISSLNRAGVVRGGGLLVAVGGVRILLVTRHLVRVGDAFRRRCPCASFRTGTRGRRESSSR